MQLSRRWRMHPLNLNVYALPYRLPLHPHHPLFVTQPDPLDSAFKSVEDAVAEAQKKAGGRK